MVVHLSRLFSGSNICLQLNIITTSNNRTQQAIRVPAVQRLTGTRNRNKTFPSLHSVGEGKDTKPWCLRRVLRKVIEQTEGWWGRGVIDRVLRKTQK